MIEIMNEYARNKAVLVNFKILQEITLSSPYPSQSLTFFSKTLPLITKEPLFFISPVLKWWKLWIIIQEK